MNDNQSWTRQPMAWFAFALPASAVVAGLVTLAIALEVSDDNVAGAQRGVAQMQVADLQADRAAATLGMRGEISIERNSGRIDLRIDGSAPVAESQIALHARHPILAERDFDILFQRIDAGHYVAATAALGIGAWNLSLESDAGRWRICGRLARGADHASLSATVPGS